MTCDRLLEIVTEGYLSSSDFNGFSLRAMRDAFPDLHSLTRLVTDLVTSKRLQLLFDGVDENPAIKRFGVTSCIEQVRLLREHGVLAACAYPSDSHLADVVDPKQYADRPFTLRLALGEPQLSFQAFDVTVLEMYRNDPRFEYECDDTQGSISLSRKYRDQMRLSQDSFLETFSFAYDDSGMRFVAVYLRYLRGLTPEHQQIWNINASPGKYRIHPDYRRITVGQPPLGQSVFNAILDELRTINAFCGQMGRPPLFKNECKEKPKEFSFLIRPTYSQYGAFVLKLDQILSDNISANFFMGEIEPTETTQRRDGNLTTQPKGTIKMLDEWLRERFHPVEPEMGVALFDGFRRVRKERQRPAHVLQPDAFDETYHQRQRDLLTVAHDSLRLLRTAFQLHPEVRPAEVPWLPPDERPIWFR